MECQILATHLYQDLVRPELLWIHIQSCPWDLNSCRRCQHGSRPRPPKLALRQKAPFAVHDRIPFFGPCGIFPMISVAHGLCGQISVQIMERFSHMKQRKGWRSTGTTSRDAMTVFLGSIYWGITSGRGQIEHSAVRGRGGESLQGRGKR